MVCFTRYETLYVLEDVRIRGWIWIWIVSVQQSACRANPAPSRPGCPYTEDEPSVANALVVSAPKLYSHPCLPSSQEGFEKRFSETVTSVQVTTSGGLGGELGGLTASASRAQRAKESHRIEGAIARAKRKNQRKDG